MGKKNPVHVYVSGDFEESVDTRLLKARQQAINNLMSWCNRLAPEVRGCLVEDLGGFEELAEAEVLKLKEYGGYDHGYFNEMAQWQKQSTFGYTFRSKNMDVAYIKIGQDKIYSAAMPNANTVISEFNELHEVLNTTNKALDHILRKHGVIKPEQAAEELLRKAM